MPAFDTWPLPRALRRRLTQLDRDVGMVARTLRGGPRPTVLREGAPPRGDVRRAGPASATRRLRVASVRRLTADAIAFEVEDAAGAPLGYRAGQFVTLLVEVDGEPLRRAYSFCSDPDAGGRAELAVKRLPGGRVSGRLVRELAPGDVLEARGPAGGFTFGEGDRVGHHVMIAGGSGITPLLGLARHALARAPEARITLLVGDRTAADAMFAPELDALAAAHPGRLRLDRVLERPAPGDAAACGRLDAPTTGARLDALGVIDAPDVTYWVCGPAPMMEAVRAALFARGAHPTRVREERFVEPSVLVAAGARASARPEPLRVHVDGACHAAVVAPGQTLLEAGLAAGIPLPFSCTLGGCGACKVRLRAGEVAAAETGCLRAEERAAGFVLACSTHARGPVEIEVLA